MQREQQSNYSQSLIHPLLRITTSVSTKARRSPACSW